MAKEIRIALAGNPNSGKTTLFNAITGLNQRTGNFPGTTVEKKTGNIFLDKETELCITDLPGFYSMYPKGEDECVSVEAILQSIKQQDFDKIVRADLIADEVITEITSLLELLDDSALHSILTMIKALAKK